MRWSLSHKLLAGFTVILLLLIFNTLIINWSVSKSQQRVDSLVQLRMPTVISGKDLMNGINSSLAALRGYMILGADPAKAEQMKKNRVQAWQLIDAAMAEYETVSSHWTDPANVERFNRLKTLIAEFRQAQQQIEAISNTDENIRSYNILLTEAAPLAEQMLAALNAIIDREEALAATPARKQLLKYLADTRGSFAIGLANIRAYLLSGDDKFEQKFQSSWTLNSQRVAQLNDLQYLFSREQASQWQQFSQHRSQFEALPQRMFSARKADNWNTANHWLATRAAPKAAEIKAVQAAMTASQQQLMQEDQMLLEESLTNAQTVAVVSCIISVILGIVISLTLARNIRRRLDSILVRANAIADGDISATTLAVRGHDELAKLTQAINGMSGSLRQVVNNTSETIEHVAGGVSDIHSLNGKMKKNVQSQSEQIDAVVTAVEELSASASDVARNIQESSASTNRALTEAQAGGETVEQLQSSMQRVDKAFMEGTDAVNTLGRRGDEVQNIIQVIKGIAEQTNLLALNAAIEAARAGDQGRGFSVVADEVRQLAQRTAEATEEVTQSVLAIKDSTQQAVMVMADGQKQVTTNRTLTEETAAALNKIIDSAVVLNRNVQTIAATAEQQSQVSNEIAGNISEIAGVAQNTQDGMIEVVSTADQVLKQAQDKARELRKMLA
ncbi:methyl-accepting chemotaxis protein [Photobacterium sp. OFAV2-7]|uniref:HAMP domain-containing methyl-accepting chemotaxis protein n=1 Tax=Photobacterium sp. OFAV2-7 TaxID=2917748 RepID=UPI001EF6A87D|nr:methyl-accepting chemotaxis protein [Photobacterium sp. OFAV2-7]MCG7587600.1 methyl-accepting chemotaxis protein [Photobacterium sp. OFAV2-7]